MKIHQKIVYATACISIAACSTNQHNSANESSNLENSPKNSNARTPVKSEGNYFIYQFGSEKSELSSNSNEPNRSTQQVPPGISDELIVKNFIQAMNSLDLEKDTEFNVREKFSALLKRIEWSIESLVLYRTQLDTRIATRLRMRFNTGTACLKNPAWIGILGQPFGLSLAEPFSFANISTADLVNRFLYNPLTIGLHYRLNETYIYSIYSSNQSRCFTELVIN